MSPLSVALSFLLSGSTLFPQTSVPNLTGKSVLQQAQPELDPELKAELNKLVQKAEKLAKASLPEKVTSRAQALRFCPGNNPKSYRVLEHKGWWIVAYCDNDSKPWLWFTGVAIRKNSNDAYHFGSW